ncbi:MAG: hypothetical protein B6I20_11540 [Bacteroidetes bacterium 4572_117]|nr:MAG: hypothetical protein B6I20_11540 [Bacteroidetes bacterium 4572_117]
MKKGKIIALIIGVLIFVTQNGYADDFTKKYNKEYKVTKNSILKLSNRYGDMHVENWDRSVVDIQVVITVKSSSKSKADDTFKKIKINFAKDGDVVSAITEIKESIRNTKFSIDYTVKMPKDINVDLLNKYGNLFLNEVNGHANINVKYGSFSINKLKRGNEKPINFVSVAYSNGICDIEEANWLKLESRYSKVSINKGVALMVGSKYSSIKVKKSKSIVAESKYDHPFKVGSVGNFICTAGYSDFEILKLYSKLEMDLKYSNLFVENLGSDFKLVKVKLRYGKASISVPENVGYELKAEAAYGSISHPGGDKISKVIDGTESTVWGIVGNNANPKAKIIIDSRYGNVRLN